MLTSKTFAADLVREIASKHARSPAAVLQRWAIQNKVSRVGGWGGLGRLIIARIEREGLPLKSMNPSAVQTHPVISPEATCARPRT